MDRGCKDIQNRIEDVYLARPNFPSETTIDLSQNSIHHLSYLDLNTMQARPPLHSNNPHPPLAPRIPLQAVQSLIPRLKAAINDVDQFQQLVASGGQNGTLPNW